MKKFLLILFVLSSFYCFSQIPSGYYNSAAGLNGLQLKIALHDIIDNHNYVDYGDLHTYYEQTDKKSNGKVWDMYSDIPSGSPPYEYSFISSHQCGNYSSEGDCYNREHSWPKSWFGGTTYPMYSDMFVVYPTDGYVNGQRGSLPYGEVSNASWTSMNGSKRGPCTVSGYSQEVFEPIDEYKGDFARSYFYMSVRYYNEDSGWPGSDMVDGAELKQWAENMLLSWHYNDPVSQKEIDRNDEVYQIQNNRNPFIDHPEWVDSIWNPLGINEEFIRKNIRLYPNPSTNIIKIEFPDSEKSNAEIIIINSTGKEIKNYKYDSSQDISLDISSLKRSFYYIKIKIGDFITYKKFIKT